MGVTQDPQDGPVIMLGLGGIFVEVIRDVVFRALPDSPGDATEMIARCATGRCSTARAGAQPVDRAALAELLVKVSNFAIAHPDISELDLNPVIARGGDFSIVDARIILSKE